MNASPLGELGQSSAYVDQYDASLLFPILRADKRSEIGISGAPPFMGADLWTAFELSWLNPRGKPQVAIAHITIPCETPCIVESKSVKLYFNSFNNTRFESADAVREAIARDIGSAVWQQIGQRVGVRLVLAEQFAQQPLNELHGLCLDRLDIDCTHYTPAPELLRATEGGAPVSETLMSHLLKSNCLVTHQPDWGSIQISYVGSQIDQAGLLQYLVSFRNHNEFHEQCVERIYMDIMRHCKPLQLSVYARYTRRGGVDINPYRTSQPQTIPQSIRSVRQ